MDKNMESLILFSGETLSQTSASLLRQWASDVIDYGCEVTVKVKGNSTFVTCKHESFCPGYLN